MLALPQTRLVLGLLLLLLTRAGAATGGLTARDRELFAWFDRLEFEDFSKATLVRVRTGASMTDYPKGYPNGKPRTVFDEPRAFLLSDANGSFRVLRGDLRPETFQHYGLAAVDDHYVGYRNVTAAQEIAALQKSLAKKESDRSWEDGHFLDDDKLDIPVQAFVLARYLAANHQDKLAAQLLREAERWVKREYHDSPEVTFKSVLQSDFAYALTFQAWMSYADPSQSRREIVRRLRLIAKECDEPRAEEGPYLKPLEAMAAEDEAHPAVSDEDLQKLPPDEQARELVFQLRNHSSEWIKENRAFDRLVALGKPAVPALLAALLDERPIRTIEPRHRLGRPAFPVGLRDVAIQVLDRIADVNFFWIAPYHPVVDSPEHWAGVRQVAADWAAALQKDREAEWFEAYAATQTGEPVNYAQETLERRFPGRVQGAALQQARDVADPAVRTAKVRRLETLDTPEVNAFLREELKRGTTIEWRAAAAHALIAHHDPDATAAMLAEWRALPHPIPPFTDHNAPDSPEPVLRLLLSSDRPEGGRAVMERWPEMTWRDRQHVLWLCSWHLNVETRERGDETRLGIRALLLLAVADDSNPVPRDPKSPDEMTNPEGAADLLTEFWPDEFHFKHTTKPAERAAQLAAVRREGAQAGGAK
jgi:hypothetical protein